jgi:riboflavin kinase/FMN adenylyltransferase
MSEKCGALPVVLTFFPHPRKVLFPQEPPMLLVPNFRKIELLAGQGIHAVVTLPFTRQFAELSADEFLTDCLYAPDIEIAGICVGSKWRFGRGGEGNAETIHRFADIHGFLFDPVEELILNGAPVSSTRIRRAVSSGLLDDAAAMLGRNYSLSGTVVHGAAHGSSVLDCPTANIRISDGILPPDGVYAGYAFYDGIRYPAAVSLGKAPTFGEQRDTDSVIEVHLIGFSGDLYGEKMKIEFVEYLREVRCYSSTEKLKEQIKKDIAAVKQFVAG